MPRDARATADMARRIERWFASAARPLPWRRRRSGWRALVAEIMLQQTQASRVAERFEAFIRRFPSPRAMSDSSEHDVLAAWQGMGYYRRAKLLRLAAIEIMSKHRGRVPRRAEALRTLPGVGRYTAGSIASIVFGEREPIVDGNVARVVLRVRGVEKPLRDPGAEAQCWREAEALVRAATSPGALNEGLMELGATVCTPRAPRCGACPIRTMCRAHSDGTTERIPAPPRTKAPRLVRVRSLVVRRGDRVLLEQRPAEGMWPSMWEPPALDRAPVKRRGQVVIPGLGPVRAWRAAGTLRHRTTHRDFRFRVFVAELDERGARGGATGTPRATLRHAELGGIRGSTARISAGRAPPATRWVSRRHLEYLPLSNAARAVLALAGARQTASRGGAPGR